MNKLKLHLDELSVESFETIASEKPKGTVFGEQCTCYTQCTCPGCPTCANYNTCDGTCPDTCANTCQNTCDDASCLETCVTCAFTCYDTCRVKLCGGYTGGYYICPIEP